VIPNGGTDSAQKTEQFHSVHGRASFRRYKIVEPPKHGDNVVRLGIASPPATIEVSVGLVA
jgi:hypothetical protein